MKPSDGFVPIEQLRPAPRVWRTLDEWAGRVPREDHEPEVPEVAGDSRRRFLQLMGASFALAGSACTRQPPEFILPYVDPPREATPGIAKFYATAVQVHSRAEGLLVESHLGRPTKAEGNPLHPASLGATSVHGQSCLLDLYDPDRAKQISHFGEPLTWEEFLIALNRGVGRGDGTGFRILTETVVSPVLAWQLQRLLAKYPAARWHQYDAAGNHSASAGTQLAFGRYLNPIYHFDAADVVLALDSDFLATEPTSTRYAREFAQRRRVRGGNMNMNRLYSVESTLTSTGGKADHRVPMRYSEVETFASQVAAAVQGGGASGFASVVARDLAAHRGRCVVIPGGHQSAALHALAHQLNSTLNAAVEYTEPIEARPEDQIASLRSLVGRHGQRRRRISFDSGGKSGL